MQFANGRAPSSRLVSISGGGSLLSGAAASWERLRNTVHARYGWWPTPTDSLSSDRPYETQERIFRERYTTSYIAGAKIKIWNGVRWYLRPGKVTAAVPGTSNHGLGVAVDITGLGGFSGARYKQLASVAQGLGWSNVEGRSIGEAWHWVFTGPAELTSGGPGTIGGEVPGVTIPDEIKDVVELIMANKAVIVTVTDNRKAQYYMDDTGADITFSDTTEKDAVNSAFEPKALQLNAVQVAALKKFLANYRKQR